ncbi:hypothetical protein [Bacteroides caecigallinarum]|uniref:hypothetical protein n=1 Tax=Bacteroides caecigallinarum TaxID=1411144 RepID=UPI001F164F9D|nr:hypothetical protein [Bacteroides caecigallinarum]MCF2737558.1 hypothetical protein [Bacteroides caecigallinarum]
MEKQLYIFNPWHDMALANFTPYFKVSSEILRMSGDLCFLPVWYAPSDAYIRIYDTDTAETFISQVSEFIRFEKSIFVENGFACDIVPWGWSPSLVHMLVKDGGDSSFLPNHETLVKIRFLSGRQRCVDVLSELSVVESTCGKAFCCYSMEDVKNYLQIYGKLILKSPWSGSGRGLCRVSPDVWSKNIEGWISRILRTQGCVMAEPIYNKVCDFAMEFYSSPEGSVSFAGYSLFETDAFGNYKQNLLLSDDEIETRLLSYNISFDTLREVRRRLIDIFNNMIAGAYTGYFGVDMMLCFQDEEMLLHPCVEINMRMNMGVVSRIIYDRYLSSSSHGYFVTEHYNSDGEALLSHRKMLSEQPLVLDSDGRIKSGYLTLTPVLSSTRYQAYVIVKE